MDGSKEVEKKRPLLPHIEAFLARRDGLDKLLKVMRYTAKLLISSQSLVSTNPGMAAKLKEFEGSLGVTRKALRFGKFVQDVNALNNSNSRLISKEGVLEVIAYCGDGFYYFVEQFCWLSKAGIIDKRHSKKLQTISAWAELIGYIGSISLKVLEISAISDQQAKLIKGFEPKNEGYCERERRPVNLAIQLHNLRVLKFMKLLSIIQDLGDAILSLSDILDGKGGVLEHPSVLALSGLVSALISAHKNWIST